MANEEEQTNRRIKGLRLRLGGEPPSGWLPPGAATPLPTPEYEVEVDLEIEHDGTGFLLICQAQDEKFCNDSWHESLEDALNTASEQYGVAANEWVID